MIELIEVVQRLNQHPVLSHSLTLAGFFQFLTFILAVENDILLAQPAQHHPSAPDIPPDHLSISVLRFLAALTETNEAIMQLCWDVFKDIAWDREVVAQLRQDPEEVFHRLGTSGGLSACTFYPPNRYCTNPSCANTLPLKEAEQRPAIFFTLDKGSIPAYSIYLYCRRCKVRYHHNYYVQNDRRHYYPGVPDILQVTTGKFVSRELVELWINQMLTAWVSLANCARIYNETLAEKTYFQSESFYPFLKGDHVWTAFVLLSLMEDCRSRDTILDVTHIGEQQDRFQEAIKSRNLRIQRNGLPDVSHYCLKCTRFYKDDGGNITHKVSVVVTDGITIGHPCCAVHNCHNPLENNRHRYCPVHADQATNCAIIGCNSSVAPGHRVCKDPLHIDIEARHDLRGQARFQLQHRLERARVGPGNTAAAEPSVNEFDLTPLGTLVAEDDGPAACPDKPHSGNRRIRAQFSRRWTHNDQIIVAPCGVIIARTTFFGAEAVKSVADFIKRVYRNAPPPEHIFFDNNCHLAKVVKEDPFFTHIGLSVDVFHFTCKHSVTDVYCQTRCNPRAFSELLTPQGDWYFNSSAAEQTNAWLGGFHAMCREKTALNYAFFLDEMIMRRNCQTLQKLTKDGRQPSHWPLAGSA